MKNHIVRLNKSSGYTSIDQLLETLQKEPNTHLLIMSEKAILKHIDSLKQHEYLFLLVDEGHSLKNPKGKFTCAVK